ncbi:hypothetical protein Aduo_019103 [Ancylostoma duodenale]
MWLSTLFILLIAFAVVPTSYYVVGVTVPPGMDSDSEISQEDVASAAAVISAPPELPIPQFAKEFFNVSTAPGSLQLDNSTYSKRARVVLQTVDSGSERFAIDFKNGDDDISLHFNPRFKENVVVLNTFYRGKWQHEERFRSPFQYLKVYTVDFVRDGKSVIIFLNGQFLRKSAERRISLENASSIHFNGDVFIHSVHTA